MNTEDTLSGFQEFFLQPIIKDRSNNFDICLIESLDSRETTDSVMFDDLAVVDDDHTYILATDADMDFSGTAIRDLLDLCTSDLRVGAVCGRTHPIGRKCSPVVWHQVFEYAKDFWMIKNAQNMIGSVSCCPGCFSLYRASALRDVMDSYASPTTTPWHVYVKDTGLYLHACWFSAA